MDLIEIVLALLILLFSYLGPFLGRMMRRGMTFESIEQAEEAASQFDDEDLELVPDDEALEQVFDDETPEHSSAAPHPAALSISPPSAPPVALAAQLPQAIPVPSPAPYVLPQTGQRWALRPPPARKPGFNLQLIEGAVLLEAVLSPAISMRRRRAPLRSTPGGH